MRFRDPDRLNGGGFNPELARVDLIRGVITGKVLDRNQDEAPRTQVTKCWYKNDWQQQDGYSVLEWPLGRISQNQYLRLRGTNQRDELEPLPDTKGENPWHDLWFYSNPIFIKVLP